MRPLALNRLNQRLQSGRKGQSWPAQFKQIFESTVAISKPDGFHMNIYNSGLLQKWYCLLALGLHSWKVPAGSCWPVTLPIPVEPVFSSPPLPQTSHTHIHNLCCLGSPNKPTAPVPDTFSGMMFVSLVFSH